MVGYEAEQCATLALPVFISLFLYLLLTHVLFYILFGE